MVSGYDFRGALDSITPENFSQAQPIDSLVLPVPAGLTQSGTLVDLDPGTTYYFALKAYDDQNNWSDLSNCVRADLPENAAVTFTDDALDSIIREHIGIPTSPLYASDLDTITELWCEEAGITDLSGLEYVTSLGVILLRGNEISDVTPLGGLIHLWGLGLPDNEITSILPLTGLTNLLQLDVNTCPISDISPIAYLTGLTTVRLHYTQVTDFSPLQSLTDLEYLNISATPGHSIAFMSGMISKLKIAEMTNMSLTDISSLSSQTDLEEVYLSYNSISDLNSLTGLTSLTITDLRWNNIEDILPLVNNTGLGEGDVVKLESNPLSAESINTYIPALQARGVTVTYVDTSK